MCGYLSRAGGVLCVRAQVLMADRAGSAVGVLPVQLGFEQVHGLEEGFLLGGEANEPMPVPSMGWFSACKDPHGNEFGLWQTDTSAPAPAQ